MTGNSKSLGAGARRRAIIPAIGTGGDVYPFIGLGRELRARGYEVTVATHAHYAGSVAAAGLEFVPLISEVVTEALMRQPDFWHPLKGPIVIARWGAGLVPRQYELLVKLVSERGTFLVANPGVLAARVVQEKKGVPLCSVILQPWIVPSIYEPPMMTGGLTLPRWAPRWVGRLYLHLFHLMGGWLFGREVKRLRRSLGLRPMGRALEWWYAPELAIGMFPSWYGAPQADWPRQVRLVGFPLNDELSEAGLSPETRAFCEAGGGGERPLAEPIVFTFGTGMMHAAALFRLGIEVCETLGRRGIFLTKYREQLPRELPKFVHHSSFESFKALFPRCAAVVHHGGIGTTAKALAAGTPQLILPFAFDQLDNGVRVTRLGAGDFYQARKRSVGMLSRKLSGVLEGSAAAAARKVQTLFTERSGIEKAVDLIDEYLVAGRDLADGSDDSMGP